MANSNQFGGPGANGSVSIIDGATNAVVATPSVGTTPQVVAANPLTNEIYVANIDSSTVSVLDGATNAVVATVTTGLAPGALGLDVVTNRIYVVNENGNSVSVISGATDSVVAAPSLGSTPIAMALNPVTNMVYVANWGDGTVSVINGLTDTVTATIPVGAQPDAIAVNPATNTVYVGSYGGNSLSVINGATDTVTATVNVGSPATALALNAFTNTVYVVEGIGNAVSVVNGASNTLTATISVGGSPDAAVVNSVTNKIYVSNTGSATVSVIDGATNTVSATLSVGANPEGEDVNPLTGQIYVVNEGDGTVSTIDEATGTVVSTTPVGNNALTVAVNPATGLVYVTNANSGSVSVIAPNATQTIPLATSVAGVVDSQTLSTTNVFQTQNPSPQFTVSVNSNYTSSSVYSSDPSAVNPSPSAVYYQVDGGAGTWQQASMTTTSGADPASFNIQLSGVPAGQHTLYVYAAYGREGAPESSAQGTGNSPDIGNVTTSTFLEVPASTSTSVISSLNPSTEGGTVTFTAHVAEVAPGTAVPTGSITFMDGSTVLGAATLDANGNATFSASALSPGSHSIAAVYGGDPNNAESTSSALSQQVLYTSTTILGSSPNPSVVGQTVTITTAVNMGPNRPRSYGHRDCL